MYKKSDLKTIKSFLFVQIEFQCDYVAGSKCSRIQNANYRMQIRNDKMIGFNIRTKESCVNTSIFQHFYVYISSVQG